MAAGCEGGLTGSAMVRPAAGPLNGQKQLPAALRASRDVLQTWSGGKLGLRGDGINISTSAIVVMFLHWQISVSCKSKLSPGEEGMEKSKTCRGKPWQTEK